MKWIKRIVLAVVLLILIAVFVVYSSLNYIVRSEVERQATASLGVTTTLASARLALFGGNVTLNDLQINSPPKFSSPQIFTLGGVGVTVNYSQLTSSPIHVQKILIDHPVLVVEQANVQLNLDALMQQMPQSPKTSSGQPTQPIKLVIDDLDLNNAQVTFMPGIPGLTNSMQITIPSLSLKNIGNPDGKQSGALIKDVVMQVATALAAKAADASKLPPSVKLVLSQDLGGLSKQLGPGFESQFQDYAGSLTKQLSPKLGNSLENLLGGKSK